MRKKEKPTRQLLLSFHLKWYPIGYCGGHMGEVHTYRIVLTENVQKWESKKNHQIAVHAVIMIVDSTNFCLYLATMRVLDYSI